MAAPPGYNPTPLTPSAGGTIHAMSGGGDGGAPPGYNSTPLIPYAAANIKAYTGGGPDEAPAAGTGPVVDVGTPTPADTTTTATTATTAAAVPVATNVVVKHGPAVSATAPSKKQISLGGLKLSIGPPPWTLKEGSNEMEALAWFGVDKAPDVKLKEEVLDALYEGVCDTDKPLIMVLECEPIRRLVQSLAEKLLGNLTRPVVKKTAAEIAAIAEQEKKKAKLMSFNVFTHKCKKETAKDYIDKSDADIVCTQQDTKTEFTNYTEIKACGDTNSATRVYLRKNTPFKIDIECVTIDDNQSAALFRYQGVTIVNMGSNDPELLKMVLDKKPNIILGSVNDIVLPSNEWTRADTINKDLNTTDAIWYKKDDNLFELKNTTVGNIKVKNDDYTKPDSCSFSDHNPITVELHFKRTLKQSASNADQAAKEAAVGSTETIQPGSLLMDAIGMPSTRQLTADELAAAALETSQQETASTDSAELPIVEVAEVKGIDDELAKKIAVAAVVAMLQDGDEDEGSASHKRMAEVQDPDAASVQVTTATELPTTPGSETTIISPPSALEATTLSTAASPQSAASLAESPSLTVPGSTTGVPLAEEPEATPVPAVEEMSDELAKKIAVAALAVLLHDFEDDLKKLEEARKLAATKTGTAITSKVSPLPSESQTPQEPSVVETSATIPPPQEPSVVETSVTIPPPSPLPLSANNNDLDEEVPPPPPTPPIKQYPARRKYLNEIPSYKEILEQSLPEYKSVLGNDTNIERTLTVLDRIDRMRDKTYNDTIQNQDGLSAIRDELTKHSKNLRSKLLAYVTTPSTTKNDSGKKIGRHKTEAILTATMNKLIIELTNLDDTLNGLKEIPLEMNPLFKEINSVAKSLPSAAAPAPLPASVPLPAAYAPASVASAPSSSTNNKALTATKKTINGMITGLTGKVNNLTENFKKKNNSTAELKKKFRSLSQQLKNEGANFTSSPAKKKEQEAVVEPVSKPTNAVSVKKQPTANELNAELLKNLQTRPSKKITLSEEDKITLEMKTLTKVIDAKKTHIRFQLQYMNHENDGNRVTEREIESQMKLIDQRMKQLNDLIQNPKVHSETIKQYQKECYDTIKKINELLTRIQPKEGGKRRTQKKRKQKKRFGTQKNNKK